MIYVYATAVLGVLSIIGLISMAVDKSKAKRGAWRIPEKVLFVIAFLGGGLGSLIGMYAFRHKTKHVSFVIGIPIGAVVSLVIVYGVAYLVGIM